MSVLVSKMVGRPASDIHWWDYLAYLGLIVFFPLALTGSPFALGIAMHMICDFTAQSNWTAMNKSNTGSPDRLKALLVHSLTHAVGSALCCGMVHGVGGFIVGAVVGFILHLAIDSTNKFSLPLLPGLISDQFLHVAIIIFLTW